MELGTEPARGGIEPLGRAVRAAPGVTVAGNVALLPGIRIERAVTQIIAARAARLPVFPEGRIRRRGEMRRVVHIEDGERVVFKAQQRDGRVVHERDVLEDALARHAENARQKSADRHAVAGDGDGFSVVRAGKVRHGGKHALLHRGVRLAARHVPAVGIVEKRAL